MPRVADPPFAALERSPWAQAAALFGSFGAAVAGGLAFGAWVAPERDVVAGLQVFALLTVFIGGMATWGTIAASIMAKAFFDGDLMLALLRFFFRGRRKEDLPRIQLDPEKIRAAAARVFGWTRIFPMIAVAVALVVAPLLGMIGERSFVGTSLLSAITTVGYGFGLRALAARGYLVPPDVE